jgi:hypothetical protein
MSDYSDVSFLSDSDDGVKGTPGLRREAAAQRELLHRSGAQLSKPPPQQARVNAQVSQEDSNVSLELSDVGSSVLEFDLGAAAAPAQVTSTGVGGRSLHARAAAKNITASGRVEMMSPASAARVEAAARKEALKGDWGVQEMGTGGQGKGGAMLIKAHRGRAANDGSGDLLAEISELSSAGQISSRSSSGEQHASGLLSSGYDQVLGVKTPGAFKSASSKTAHLASKAARGPGSFVQADVGKGLPQGLSAADVFYGYKN